MWEFLTFRKMMIPALVQFIFWIGTVACVVVGLMVTGGSFGVPAQPGIVKSHVWWGAATILGGPFVLRIWCEWTIVFFRMNDTLSEIRKNTMRKGR